MTAYLIDTNHAAQIMADQAVLGTRLASDRNNGDQFYTCITVLGELYFAAYASRRKQQNLHNLASLLEHIPVLRFDQSAAEEYGRIKAELKAQGRPIPGTDAQIAAVACLHNLVVLTSDRHFAFVDGLQVENWL
jgi:tRNA(fMet)-specific endonuclease VapC